MADDRLRDLARRLRRRSDGGDAAVDKATTGDSGDSLDAVETPGPPAEDPQDARTPKGSNGVPYRPGDPRFPDVWGADRPAADRSRGAWADTGPSHHVRMPRCPRGGCNRPSITRLQGAIAALL
jgi:hypothetical protein